jgi:peptidoglycan/xylan/chitin deacetylase (PgdA/CDA1 family)
MKLPGAKAIRQSVRWLQSRFLRGALILGYHRVGQDNNDPYALQVSTRHFAEQMEVLCQRAHQLQLHDVLGGLRDQRLPRRAVAISFDDGYADTLHVALPVLERFKVPATVFVTTGNLGQEFWWHELARLLSGRTAFARPLYERVNASGNETPALIQRRFHAYLAQLSLEQRQATLAELRTCMGPGPIPAPTARCLDAREVSQLAESGWITIGAHSVTHPALARHPTDCQRWEIRESQSRLQALSGRPVTLFSYPHGSMTATTRALVAEAGFVGACGSANAVAWSGSDPFGLPRFWVPDWGAARFGRWLDWWLCR